MGPTARRRPRRRRACSRSLGHRQARSSSPTRSGRCRRPDRARRRGRHCRVPRAEIEIPSPSRDDPVPAPGTRKLIVSCRSSQTTLPRGTPFTYGLHWSLGVRSMISSEPFSMLPTRTPLPLICDDAAAVLDQERAAGVPARRRRQRGQCEGEQGQSREAHTNAVSAPACGRHETRVRNLLARHRAVPGLPPPNRGESGAMDDLVDFGRSHRCRVAAALSLAILVRVLARPDRPADGGARCWSLPRSHRISPTGSPPCSPSRTFSASPRSPSSRSCSTAA